MPNHTYDTNKETMKTSIYISGQSTEEETLSSTVAGTKRIQKKKFQAGLKHLCGSLNIVVVLLWWFSEFQETFLLLLFWQDHRCMFCLEHSFCLVMTISDIVYIFVMQFLGTWLLRLWKIDLAVMND